MVSVAVFSTGGDKTSIMPSGNTSLFNAPLSFSLPCQTKNGSNNQKAKPEPCLRVSVIYANAYGTWLAEYVYFFWSVVEYHERIDDSLRSEMCEYILKEAWSIKLFYQFA